MNVKKIGVIEDGQDGVIFGNYLFRFKPKGSCVVYKMDELSDNSVPVSKFELDKADVIAPHSNSVSFSSVRYRETDEFPLLYSNVYNNYAKADNQLCGVTCVYRLQREGNTFSTTLLQLIEIGFTDDTLWRSADGKDIRPYGNFAIDVKNGTYFAFTMRDEEQNTRYFAFDLPDINDGVYDDAYGVKRVVLGKEDIHSYFDCEYHHYVQGACFHNGLIYSVEGFTNSESSPPALRIIDTNAKKEKEKYYFADFGSTVEPEFIDFKDGVCYYIDGNGNVYNLIF